MVRPVLHVARVDATVWAGSPDHALSGVDATTSLDEGEIVGINQTCPVPSGGRFGYFPVRVFESVSSRSSTPSLGQF